MCDLAVKYFFGSSGSFVSTTKLESSINSEFI